MTPARVLLVDDDASIRRFVALALEDLPVDLQQASGVAEALALLRCHGPVQLLLTDLMMPGESGLDLLHTLQEQPALRGQARLVVFSAGLGAIPAAQLEALDVWRVLDKPIALGELQACVEAALAGTLLVSPSPEPIEAAPPPQATAVQRHFGGDQALFDAFLASCLPQFVADLRQGDAAAARGDLQALRHLSHSLKSVLATLGHDELSAEARQLEEAAHGQDAARAHKGWERLRAGLEALLAK